MISFSATAFRQRRLRFVRANGEEGLNRGLMKNLRGRQTNKPGLLPGTEEHVCGIWKAGAADEV